MVKLETRLIPFLSRDGKRGTFPLRYKLFFKDGKLNSIVNQNGFTIEKESETFEYYTSRQ